jgi:hypothetical protein
MEVAIADEMELLGLGMNPTLLGCCISADHHRVPHQHQILAFAIRPLYNAKTITVSASSEDRAVRTSEVQDPETDFGQHCSTANIAAIYVGR